MDKKELNEKELSTVAGGSGGAVVASGSFASSTGTQLNLLVNWSVQADGFGNKTLYVDVNTTSYSLYSSGGGVELTANGMMYAASASPVSYGGNTMAVNHLASFSVPGVYGAVSLGVVWHFNGSYSGTPIGDIRAYGVVNV